MITTTDIGNILYRDATALGLDVYQGDNIPQGDVTEERVHIHVRRIQHETIWKKCFVNINVLVPDINEYGNEDLVRLQELERECYSLFKSNTGEYDGTCYTYSLDEIGIEAERDLRCHFVSVRILFEQLNLIGK